MALKRTVQDRQRAWARSGGRPRRIDPDVEAARPAVQGRCMLDGLLQILRSKTQAPAAPLCTSDCTFVHVRPALWCTFDRRLQASNWPPLVQWPMRKVLEAAQAQAMANHDSTTTSISFETSLYSKPLLHKTLKTIDGCTTLQAGEWAHRRPPTNAPPQSLQVPSCGSVIPCSRSSSIPAAKATACAAEPSPNSSGVKGCAIMQGAD